MRTKHATNFKKGDRVRLTKKARDTFVVSPRCDGIAKVMHPTSSVPVVSIEFVETGKRLMADPKNLRKVR